MIATSAIAGNYKRAACILVSLLILLIFLFIPTPDGLKREGFLSIAILLIAVAFWISEVLPPVITSAWMMALLPIFNTISFAKSIEGFADSITCLLVSVFALAAAAAKTGLDRRIALSMLKIAGTSSRKLIVMLNLTIILIAFIFPTGVARSAIFLPICMGLTSSLSLIRGNNLAKILLLMPSFASLTFSSAIITAGANMVYAASLFERVTGYSWTYFSWLLTMLPGALATSLLVGPILIRVFPPEAASIEGGARYIREELGKMGKLSRDEYKAIIVFSLLILLWLTNFLHKMPLAQVALILALVTFLPGIELLTWQEARQRIDWGTIIIFGSSIALANALKDTGAAYWLAKQIFALFRGLDVVPMALALLVFLALARVSFNNVFSFTVTLLPIVLEASKTVGYNPLWMGLLTVTGGYLCLFLPMQSVSHMITFSAGYYSTADMFKAGIIVTIVFVAIAVLSSSYYWPCIGISPR